MAFESRGQGGRRASAPSDRRTGGSTGGSSGFLRWFAIPVVTVGVATWGIATLAGLHSAASIAYAEAVAGSPLSIEAQLRQLPHPHDAAANGKKLLLAPVGKPAAIASVASTSGTSKARPKAVAALKPPVDPFADVVTRAKLSREKLLSAFATAGMVVADTALEAKTLKLALAMPSAERFHYAPGEHVAADAIETDTPVDPFSSYGLGQTGPQATLAYASVDDSPSNPVVLALASLSDDPFGMDGDTGMNDLGPTDQGQTDIGTDNSMPDSIDLPPARPEQKPAKADAKPKAVPADVAEEPAAPVAPARKPARSDAAEPQQALAFARPDNPTKGVAGAFKNLFNGPKAGNGIAVYDISASVVHMPDGSKLEAHSGIGKMADNPSYVHVKMNGPTPPNTYKLSMREKRFHGVEAVRMTPVGKETMHGRTGILAHSYLLRGGRAESHGCVAFKDYPKFLKAFKQGKVTHIVVVPSMSRAPKIQMVSNGRGA